MTEEYKNMAETCAYLLERESYFEPANFVMHMLLDVEELESKSVEKLTDEEFKAEAERRGFYLLKRAANVVPLTWEEAQVDDAFLEIKGDEYIDAALNIFAFGHDDEIHEDDHILYITHGEDSLKLMGTDYGKTWRCWPRRPTEEERFEAKWGDEDDA